MINTGYKQLLFIQIILILCTSCILLSYDNLHFYRPSLWYDESHSTLDYLTKGELQIYTGSAHTSFDKYGHRQSLLDLYGPQNMVTLGLNNPTINSDNPYDALLLQLSGLPAYKTFGTMSLTSKFSYSEFTACVTQNLWQGFFMQAYLPLRHLALSTPNFVDLSPSEGLYTSHTEVWQTFLAQQSSIFTYHNISLEGSNQWGSGDLSLIAGWAKNYYNTQRLDYVDIDVRAGILVPTAKHYDPTKPFRLPLGYNGHTGLSFMSSLSIGYLEWLTLGTTINGLFLLPKHRILSVKTSEAQQGILKLYSTTTHINPGTYWNVALYVKIDHLCKGFSFLLGYSYSLQQKDYVKIPSSRTLETISAHDKRFKGWSMHTLSYRIEYDPNDDAHHSKPIVQLSYNQLLKGQQVFNSTALGGGLSLISAWRF